MKRRIGTLTIALLVLTMWSNAEPAARETARDRKVRLEEEIILDIPDIPPLCDGMDIEKGRIDIGDCELYYELEGKGMPVVLLHGGPGGTHHGFHPHFSKATDFATVIYYDQRGCGISDYKAGPGFSIGQAVDDLDKLRQALGYDRWVVLGHSYGGLLAQCYAVKYPERLAGLVLVGSSLAMTMPLKPGREQDFLSQEERRAINRLDQHKKLSLATLVFNKGLNGDWKRQNYYRPTVEELARRARHEWKHSARFISCVGSETRSINVKGAFEQCPVPTLVIEGTWDLTWNTDKPGILQGNHPGSTLLMFEKSAHSPFADEPDRFFAALQAFAAILPETSAEAVTQWRQHIDAWKAEQEKLQKHIAFWKAEQKNSPNSILLRAGWGHRSNKRTAAAYTAEWLNQLDRPSLFLKLGFALYDVKRYEEARQVFEKMSAIMQESPFDLAISKVWQAHMLDLMDKRDESLLLYQEVVDMNVTGTQQHGQFGMKYAPSPYASERLQTPFKRVENKSYF